MPNVCQSVLWTYGEAFLRGRTFAKNGVGFQWSITIYIYLSIVSEEVNQHILDTIGIPGGKKTITKQYTHKEA